MRAWSLFGLAILLADSSFAFKENDFKKCSQSGFCRRGRALAARAKEAKTAWTSPYSLDPLTIEFQPNRAVLTAEVKNSLYPNVTYGFELQILQDDMVRVKLDETSAPRKRYNEAASWALIQQPELAQGVSWALARQEFRASFGPQESVEIVVKYNPFRLALTRSGKEQVVLNGEGLLHMEHFRNKNEPTPTPEITATETPAVVDGENTGGEQAVMKDEKPHAWFEGDTEDAYWEETFGSWTDSKPKGPESLSVDIMFPNHGTVYGIPQHATRMALPTTAGENPFFSDPYRLYNADVFEYLASSPVSLYGSIPLMHAHSAESTVGVFHVVASETWIDVAHASGKSTETHWISESGIMDIFLLSGPTPQDVFRQYTTLTGTPVLPAQWSLGYHQCRWNYITSDDVRGVQKRFDEEDIPVDVFWLDIEYSDDHKYFMWNEKTFPDPVEMTNEVAENGRKMVVIVDPHLKRTQDYPAYKEASELGILVKPKNGEGEYEGWCWPGSSSWTDFFNPQAWDWWKKMFKTQSLDTWSWTKSTTDIHIWNDMNEPSVFNGPEITMPKDNIHHGGWEHRDIHNINGMLFSNLTHQAVAARTDPPMRPFVLTRAFYAGSQRFGAMWTGDNLGTWEHMAVGVKMVLANGLGGLSFAGSDVGGFFGNPDTEMLVRWYQVGAFAPFFRAHAHIDTKRREPYLLDEPYKNMVKSILRLRYTMLPIWYTAFRETSVTGVPILRPQFIMFPKDKNGFEIDDQYYIGSSGLLVKPVTEKDVKETKVYLAEDQVYYDYFSNHAYRGTAKGKEITVPADLAQIPLLIRGGSVVSTRERPRRSSPLMKHDPFTLRVALSKASTAKGDLYLDDGESYNHVQGNFVWREFVAEKLTKKLLRIANKDLGKIKPWEAVDGVPIRKFDSNNDFAKDIKDVRVEKVVVVGLNAKPSSIKVENGDELEWSWTPGIGSTEKKEGQPSVLTIRDPRLLIAKDWNIHVHL